MIFLIGIKGRVSDGGTSLTDGFFVFNKAFFNQFKEVEYESKRKNLY